LGGSKSGRKWKEIEGREKVRKENKGMGQVKPARFGLQKKIPSCAIAKYIHVLILEKVLPLIP